MLSAGVIKYAWNCQLIAVWVHGNECVKCETNLHSAFSYFNSSYFCLNSLLYVLFFKATVPLLEERYKAYCEAGRVLLDHFNGSFANCVRLAFHISSIWLNTLMQWFPKIFVCGTLQGYYKWTKNPCQNCQVNINAFFTQIAVITQPGKWNTQHCASLMSEIGKQES